MEGQRARHRAARILALIAIIQAPLATAVPFALGSPRNDGRADATVTATTCDENARQTPLNTVYDFYDAPGVGPASAFDVVHELPNVASISASSTGISVRDAQATSSFSTSVPDQSLTSLSISEVQSATLPGPTSTSGTFASTLNPSLQVSSQPFASSIPSPTSSLEIIDTATLSVVQPIASRVTQLVAEDIFRPIGTGAPLVPAAPSDHPVRRTSVCPQSRKLQTNKFYSALYLDNQTSPVYMFPYSVSWAKGRGELKSWGLAISHTEREQWARAAGVAPKDAGEWAFFGAPVGIQSIILSASELAETTDPAASYKTPGITLTDLEWGSVKANLFAPGWQTPTISFPLLQGMAFVTGEYHWAKPLIQSSIGIRSIRYDGPLTGNLTYKYTATLNNDLNWLIYVTPEDWWYEAYRFDLDPRGSGIIGPEAFNGIIQVAKVPVNAAEDVAKVYDNAAGAYPLGVNITGTVDNETGTYTLTWDRNGTDTKDLLMFALPHHLESMSYPTRDGFTSLQIDTTTKGAATAVRGNSWTMTEAELPISMGFAPWRPGQNESRIALQKAAMSDVQAAAQLEFTQNIGAQTNVSSAYYDGKALAKFAAMCYAVHQMVGNETLALSGLEPLKQAFADHIDNKQTWPFVYDNNWGGVVSVASYKTGNPLEDFGNAWYNDHHFHYGYFVYAASVIGFLDPTWLQNSTNVDWVNMLVRDYASSDLEDPYFPFSRNFDWYHGHSWAGGLFDSADGKNQESSSEDTMASYAIKMWGQVIGDKYMQARGNLMLAIQKRSFAHYYLYSNSETPTLPSEFVGNKVAGILFENKADHTTYFGAEPEYIQGIHMIPILPFSTYIRTPSFVAEEWEAYFSNQASTQDNARYVDTVEGGWRGLLWANYALANSTAARESYDFFRDTNERKLDRSFLDGGASQTWYLAFAAALVDGELY